MQNFKLNETHILSNQDWTFPTNIAYGPGRFKEIGNPILIGTSRKSTIGNVLNLPINDRLEGTAASLAISISKGADIIRVHDVKEMNRVAKMSDAIIRGWDNE